MIIYVQVSVLNTLLGHPHADMGILFKGGYIMKISQITSPAVHMNVMD